MRLNWLLNCYVVRLCAFVSVHVFSCFVCATIHWLYSWIILIAVYNNEVYK
jgi:hypothetical protein